MKQAARLDRTLAALAEPSRRLVVDLLREKPHAAGELADRVGLSPAALSRHLKTLKSAGLVDETHPTYDARVRIYRFRPAPIADLREWLAATETLWSRQLAAFKARVEDAG